MLSNDKISNHYVPRLVLRKFSKKLCLYNVKTGELQENIPPEHAYAHNNLYDIDTERYLNERIESQFGNLLSKQLKNDRHLKIIKQSH